MSSTDQRGLALNQPDDAPVEERAPDTFPMENVNDERSVVSEKLKLMRKWRMRFVLVVLATIGTIIAAIIIGVNEKNDSSSPSAEPATVVTSPPIDDPQQQLDILRQALATNEFTMKYLEVVPENAETLKVRFQDEMEDAVVRAASWLVHEDPLNQRDQLVSRFALAVIYFAAGGPNWKVSTNWLTESPVCDMNDGWHGIVCDLMGKLEIHQIDLDDNNLQGTLSDVYALLTDLRVISLSDNALTGTVPGPALASLPKLIIVRLDNNNFSGSLPDLLPDGEAIITRVDPFPNHAFPDPAD